MKTLSIAIVLTMAHVVSAQSFTVVNQQAPKTQSVIIADKKGNIIKELPHYEAIHKYRIQLLANQYGHTLYVWQGERLIDTVQVNSLVPFPKKR